MFLVRRRRSSGSQSLTSCLNRRPTRLDKIHQRVGRFLLEYTYVADPDRDKGLSNVKLIFDGMDAAKFDEAFLTRNCLVHNGGRVSSALAGHTRRPVGAPIEFDAGVLGPMLKPIRDLADALGALHF